MLTGSAPNGRADIKHKAQIKKTRRPGEGTGGSRDLGLTRSIEGMEIASHVRRTVFVADSARQDEAIIFEGCFGGVSAEDFFVSVCIDPLGFSIFCLIFIQLHNARAGSAGSGGEIRGGGLRRCRERNAGVRTTPGPIAQGNAPTVRLAELLRYGEPEATAASFLATR